ncbi:uncharacterized protein CEXT_380501 [Caerostris extrusa]|uniref:Uncharacterized protein n=1 Tax=Caerostris extrusa TaxID=172846 RepID=A0AAV4M2H2_CAEEX|nr:uncharacterized protein CEXT_380501 [Caerostris extrusa]
MRKGLEKDQKESKNDQTESGDVQQKTENDNKESVKSLPETISHTENKEKDFEHVVAKTEEPEEKPSDSQDTSKRANLRKISVERIKRELKKRETKLLRSVRKIEKYTRDIYSLKREADDMYEKINANAIEQGLHFTMLSEECDDVLSKTTLSKELLPCYTPAKACLRDIVCDIQNLGNEKKVVEYYLLLQMLKQDLLEEDKKCITEAQDFTNERRDTSERLRTHPLKILEKENIIQNINNEIKDIRSKNIEMEQQVSTLFSAKVKDELTWYNIQRWIIIIYQTICEIMPPDIDEPKETYLDKLQKMETFVVMGHKIIERCNNQRK